MRVHIKQVFQPFFTAVAIACAGCASPSQDTKIAEPNHDFLVQGDNAPAHIGAHPTYVALERFGPRDYRVLAVSNAYIPLKRANQEELYFTLDYSNVVPAWQKWEGQCQEDARTEKRTCTFDNEVLVDRRRLYMPSGSAFVVLNARGQLALSLEFQIVSRDQKILEAAKTFWQGNSKYPTAIDETGRLQLPKVTFLVKPEQGGEVAQYYFVPTYARVANGEYIDVGSNVYFEHFMFAWVKTPYQSMKRLRTTTNLGAEKDTRCVGVMLDIDQEKGLPRKICWTLPHETPMKPLWAQSPTLGKVQIDSLDGTAYTLDGKKLATTRLPVNLFEVHELRQLSEDETARLNLH